MAVADVTPGPDGTAHYPWVPSGATDVHIELIITGTTGTVIDKTFHVTIGKHPITPGPVTPHVGTPGFLERLSELLQDIGNFIKKLPPLIKYGLPWFLFALLVADIVYLTYHIRREIKEQKKLEALIEHEREISTLKKIFLSLASHYMRTPLATLMGGADLLEPINKTAFIAITNFNGELKALSAKIEDLIRTNPESSLVTISKEADPEDLKPTWRRPMLIIPVILIGICAFSFDFLVQQAGTFDVGQINLIAQVIVFGSVAMLLYSVAHLNQLHKAALKRANAVLAEEANFNEQRDSFIRLAGTELSTEVNKLDTSLSQLGVNPATKFLTQGQGLLHTLVTKLRVAQQITGSAAGTPYVSTQAGTVFAAALQPLADKIKANNVDVKLKGDFAFQTQSPELLEYVMQTVIDNAIAYSPENSHIEIDANSANGLANITITDHGTGISEDKKYGLFQAFSKLEGAEVFNHEGMGFSLYLDKLIVSYLHGQIAIDSVKPMGTEVTLTLPLGATT